MDCGLPQRAHLFWYNKYIQVGEKLYNSWMPQTSMPCFLLDGSIEDILTEG